MTAAAPHAAHPTIMAGTGWTADVYDGYVSLTIHSTAPDDVLPGAIEAILSPVMRRFWTVEWTHEDEHGDDVYLLQRGASLL